MTRISVQVVGLFVGANAMYALGVAWVKQLLGLDYTGTMAVAAVIIAAAIGTLVVAARNSKRASEEEARRRRSLSVSHDAE